MNTRDYDRIIQAELTGIAAVERITRGEPVDLAEFGDDVLVWPMFAAVVNFAATAMTAFPEEQRADHFARVRHAIAQGQMHVDEEQE